MQKKYSVGVVIPVYNEEKELEENIKVLHRFLSNNLKDWKWKITIADNASTDNTLNIAQKLAKNVPEIQALHLPQKGRGRAIKKAWQESKTDVVSYMDVDLSTQLEHFPSLINSLKNKSFDIAIGSRLLTKSVVEKRTLKREIISRCYNLLIRLIFFTKFSDAQCGFKATTRQVVDNLVPYILDNEWFFDSELLIVGEKIGRAHV